MHIYDAADYIIWKVCEGGETLNQLKLQKLAYYSEAWNWAIEGVPLTQGPFQAWVHGPVNRELFDRFKDTKTLYSPVTLGDRSKDFAPEKLDVDECAHIDRVLEVYASLTGSQLETLTHSEEPWIEARRGFAPTERCEKEISTETMRRFYGARLQ